MPDVGRYLKGMGKMNILTKTLRKSRATACGRRFFFNEVPRGRCVSETWLCSKRAWTCLEVCQRLNSIQPDPWTCLKQTQSESEGPKYACGLPCPHLRAISDFSVTISILTCVGISRLWQNTDMEMLRVPDVVEPSRKTALPRILGIHVVLEPQQSTFAPTDV